LKLGIAHHQEMAIVMIQLPSVGDPIGEGSQGLERSVQKPTVLVELE
jgi:hypothetical protein